MHLIKKCQTGVVLIAGTVLFAVGTTPLSAQPMIEEVHSALKQKSTGHYTELPLGQQPNVKTRDAILRVIQGNAPIVKKAVQAINQGEYTIAIELLTKSIEHAPIDPNPYILLTSLYFNLGQDSKATQVLEMATDVDIDFNNIFEQLDHQILQAKDVAEAVPSEKAWIAKFKDNKRSAVSYIFDDGQKSVYTDGLPVFDRFGYKATLNIVPGGLGSSQLAGTWNEWRDAHKRGFEIGNHSLTHPLLHNLSPQVLESEINESFDILSKEIGEAPFSFAYPFERFPTDKAVVSKILERHHAIINRGFLEMVYPDIFHPTVGGKYFSSETIKAITAFTIRKNIWLLVQGHGVARNEERTYRAVTKKFLFEHLKFIKKNEKDIWIDTFKNIYSYLYERNRTTLTVVQESMQGITLKVSHSFDPEIYSIPLTVVVNPGITKLKNISAKQDGKPLKVKIIKGLIHVEIKPLNSVVEVRF